MPKMKRLNRIDGPKTTSLRAIVLTTLLVFATQTTLAQNVAAIDPASEAAEAMAAAEAEANSPVAIIETFHAGLLQIMKEAKTLGFEGRCSIQLSYERMLAVGVSDGD